MTSGNERRLILEMIQNGKISADEGLRLLKALESDGLTSDRLEDRLEDRLADEAPDFEPDDYEEPASLQDLAEFNIESATSPETSSEPASTGPDPRSGQGQPAGAPSIPDMERWRRLWIIPLWIGVGVTILSALLLYRVLQTSGVGLLFFCSGLPFLLGIALLIIALQSRTARWLHVRVQRMEDDWPKNIAISLPIPIGATAWFLRKFRTKIRGLENTSIDEIIMALGNTTTPENPLYVEVEDGDDGEKVQIFIG